MEEVRQPTRLSLAVACGAAALVGVAACSDGVSTDDDAGGSAGAGTGGSATGTGGSSSGTGGGPPVVECPVPPDQFDAAGPSPSFADDVHPILLRSCALVLCHTDWEDPPQGLIFGSADQPSTPALRQDVADQLLSPAAEAPGLQRVEPGDPTRSYLMLKMDGCQNSSGLACIGTTLPDKPCGDSMPQMLPPRPARERDLIRRWIADGAVFD